MLGFSAVVLVTQTLSRQGQFCLKRSVALSTQIASASFRWDSLRLSSPTTDGT